MTVHAAPTTESILYNDCRAIGESESSLTKQIRGNTHVTSVAFPRVAKSIHTGSGSAVAVPDPLARGSEPAHSHYDVRYLLVAEPGATTVSDESRAVEWVGLDEAERRNPEPSIARMAAKARALRRAG